MSFKEVSCLCRSLSITIFWNPLRLREFLRSSMDLLWLFYHEFCFCVVFPSMVNTERFSRNLFVVGEDEFQNIYVAVSGKHPFDILYFVFVPVSLVLRLVSDCQNTLSENFVQAGFSSCSVLSHCLRTKDPLTAFVSCRPTQI